MDYLPNASSEDVYRILKRDFNPADHRSFKIARCTRAASRADTQWEGVEGVREQVDVAKRDVRDVIAPAEYPGFWRVGFVGVGKMTQDERESVKARDWQQYEAWLTRE